MIGLSAVSVARLWARQVPTEAAQAEKSERIEIKSDLTVEHVMPQSWEEYWPLPPENDNEEGEQRRSDLVQTFGNLTLLTHKLNSSVSNGPYDTKRPAITQQSRLLMNAYFQNQPIWNEDTIMRRGHAQFELAAKIWPRPT